MRCWPNHQRPARRTRARPAKWRGRSVPVAKSMGDYLDSHPETNQVMTAVLQQQVGPGSVASLKAHFEANPKVASDLHALSQPLTDLSTRCSLPISGLQAIGLMQAVQGARR